MTGKKRSEITGPDVSESARRPLVFLCLLTWSPTNEPQASAGPSIEKPASHLDNDFDFQLVVFEVYFPVFKSSHEEKCHFNMIFFQKVENTLFKVLRNGFNIPETPFEAMFSLPQTQTDGSIEGNSLENPIHLPGVKVEHFRSFLRILYPLCVFHDTSLLSIRVFLIFSKKKKLQH